jgi:hypothetical protein
MLLSSAANTPTSATYCFHIDGGANRSITPFKHHLIHFRIIKAYHVLGVNKEDPALTVTGTGYLPWCAPGGTILLVRCLYSSQAADTIISPTDVVLNHQSHFIAWVQHSNISTKTGYIDFLGPDDSRVCFPLMEDNGLWFYTNSSQDDYQPTDSADNPVHT